MTFTYACIAKPPSMSGAVPDGHKSYDETDTRGVYGVVKYKKPLPKSDEDLCGLRLVDGPHGKYQVSAIERVSGRRVALASYIGKGYDIMRRADLEAARHGLDIKDIALEWAGIE